MGEKGRKEGCGATKGCSCSFVLREMEPSQYKRVESKHKTKQTRGGEISACDREALCDVGPELSGVVPLC